MKRCYDCKYWDKEQGKNSISKAKEKIEEYNKLGTIGRALVNWGITTIMFCDDFPSAFGLRIAQDRIESKGLAPCNRFPREEGKFGNEYCGEFNERITDGSVSR